MNELAFCWHCARAICEGTARGPGPIEVPAAGRGTGGESPTARDSQEGRGPARRCRRLAGPPGCSESCHSVTRLAAPRRSDAECRAPGPARGHRAGDDSDTGRWTPLDTARPGLRRPRGSRGPPDSDPVKRARRR
jgi:hypothetical protein